MNAQLIADLVLHGDLNVHTMEVGNGRDIELARVDDNICWRRVGDTTWNILFALEDVAPVAGVDYLTEDDFELIATTVAQGITLYHTPLLGREDEDSHPISAITDLQQELDNRVHKLESPVANNLVVASPTGELIVSDSKCSDFVSENNLSSILSSLSYVHEQTLPASVWYVLHNLDKYPSIIVVDDENRRIVGEVKYLSRNELKVQFNSSFSGKVYCN